MSSSTHASLLRFFNERFGDGYCPRVPLNARSYIRLGGVAEHVLFLKGEKEMEAFERHVAPRFLYGVLGKASNSLISDKGISIPLALPLCSNKADELTRIAPPFATFHAGMPLAKAVRVAQFYRLGGLEFALGIPGSVGGAVVMNAGAEGSEIGEVLESVLLFRDNAFQWIPATALNLSYRKSNIASYEVVMAARFRLKQEAEKTIRDLKRKCLAALSARKRKQPLGLPSLGSTFKNPKGNHAARLIEACGLKNLRVGGIQVSSLHANFIVNTGSGTALEAKQLIEKIRHSVAKKTNIVLQTEIHELGEF